MCSYALGLVLSVGRPRKDELTFDSQEAQCQGAQTLLALQWTALDSPGPVEGMAVADLRHWIVSEQAFLPVFIHTLR